MRTPDRLAKPLTGWRIYAQIAERLRHRITSGEYAPGSTLPSEAVLSAEFYVARNTVRRALTALEEGGLILTVPSKGRIVRPAAQEAEVSYRYQEIAKSLRGRIERGELGPGDALPSEAELRWLFSAARSTVRQAFAELESEGLVVSRHGKGRFVRSSQ
ncbi:GntR family transcriptional regulator [Microtetraspora sp. AC03309]|uniref:GntR family transcriptional regulator n=1 Tax=Microtetraspora sp. AC03309 TaxID=2779376 RepID=UPI001E4789F4|nr:GntR family transcriptional regulator [Microtetraspora sp. AC03309]